MTWFQAMLATPDEPMTPLARYTRWNGWFYGATGALLYAMPGMLGPAGGQPLVGQEPGLVRVLGGVIAIIGWFYVMGARTNRDSFCLATVADRIAVPFVLVPVILWGGVDPMLVGPFVVLDPILALGAYLIWRRSQP